MFTGSFRAMLCLMAVAGPNEGVFWRHNFDDARREAAQRPLLLDFGTANCFWCKKLDASTFQTPSVIRLLNESFVPVKIDAERQAQLAQALRVQSYPTLILLSTEGKVLWRTDGYIEPEPLLRALHPFRQKNPRVTVRTTAPPVPPLIDFSATPQSVIRGQKP